MPLSLFRIIARIINNRCGSGALYSTNLLNKSYQGKLLMIAERKKGGEKKISTSIVPYNTEAGVCARRPLMAKDGTADSRGEKQLWLAVHQHHSRQTLTKKGRTIHTIMKLKPGKQHGEISHQRLVRVLCFSCLCFCLFFFFGPTACSPPQLCLNCPGQLRIRPTLIQTTETTLLISSYKCLHLERSFSTFLQQCKEVLTNET